MKDKNDDITFWNIKKVLKTFLINIDGYDYDNIRMGGVCYQIMNISIDTKNKEITYPRNLIQPIFVKKS